MYPFRSFTLQLGALIQRISPGRFWASALVAGLILLIAGGIGVGAVLVGRARPVAPAAGQPAQALQVMPQSAPQPDTTAYYLRAQEQQAVRMLAESTPVPDTTAYYLRAQEQRAVRDFWARAVVPDTTAYYLCAQEQQAIRTLRETHP
ncbi:MAG TPA: hypothetical protein VF909_04185 [Roseiflexaceae bacterium]